MKTFKDAKGRTWDIVVNVNTAKRVLDVTGIDILDLFSDEGQKVLQKPYALVVVIYNLCHKQIEDRKVSEEDFGESLVGDAIEQAATALLESVIDFFPQSRRVILNRLMDKSKEAADILTTEAMTKLEAIDVASLTSAMKLAAK